MWSKRYFRKSLCFDILPVTTTDVIFWQGQEAARTIQQFHYIAWPDFGVPSNASHILQFRRRINDGFDSVQEATKTVLITLPGQW